MGAEGQVSPAVSRVPMGGYGAILWIGLIAGTLDIGDNLIYNALRGVTPAMVFRFIGSGLVGVRVIQQMGGAGVALGVVMHYCIALSWTALFFIASRKMAFLRRQAAISGMVYGLCVYLFMTRVVVPLSRVPHLTLKVSLAGRINAVLAVVLCIGLTISLLTKWSEGRR